MARLNRRKSTPQSPAKVRSAPTSPRQTRRSTRTQSHEPNQLASSALQDPQKSLDPVLEEENTIALRISQPVDDDTGREDDDELGEVDDEDFDDYSASEDDDLAALDKDIIIDNLSAINLDTNDIFRLLSSSPALKVFEDVQNPFSATAKRLNHFARRLLTNLEPCGYQSLLQPSRLSYLLDKGVPSEARSNAATASEPIFMKANLALFIVKLLQGRWSDQDTPLDDMLSYLTEIQTFPTPFFERDQSGQVVSSSSSRDFRQATLSLGVSLLTQCYVRYAIRKSVDNDFDPDTLLLAVFLEDDDEKVRDVSLGAFATKSKAALTKVMHSRVHDIRKFFRPGDGIGIDLEGLAKSFPAKDFVEQAISWTFTRRQQLDQAVEKQGGIEAIRDGLLHSQATAIAEPRKPRRQSRKSREARALEEGASFLRNVDEFLDATAAIESQSQEHKAADVVPELPQVSVVTPRRRGEVAETPQPDNTSRPPLHEQHVEQTPVDEGQNANIINDDVNSPAHLPPSAQVPPGSTQDVLARSDRQQAVANKENIPQQRSRLYDRQVNATREAFDSPNPAPRNAGKRAHRASQGSDGEDYYEADTRNVKRPRIHASKVPVRQSHQDDDSGMFIRDNEDPEAEDPTRSSRLETPRHRAQPSLTQPTNPRSPSNYPSPTPPAATYESYLRTKEQAKANMGMTTALLSPSANPSTNLQAAYPSHQTTHARIQVRRSWTPGEIERLIHLIQEYQTQWSKMLKVDAEMDVPMLQNRTQVQLKDKARNMKLDYLKAEMELPPGFEGVTVSKAHKETFRRLGIAVEVDATPSEA
ncbi:hypothetical protein H2198_009037 [Neophaeococcomyces mojaviensis]|uniref:Uncharacterized protein n=1 Tax=Neophaeococcomyces mojaviensis TaxID=3383035 RepID=A0ACC2ZVK6_9EURO|nr:hypothetical protein H2198_009037 [Knufia sp. JES_112]